MEKKYIGDLDIARAKTAGARIQLAARYYDQNPYIPQSTYLAHEESTVVALRKWARDTARRIAWKIANF